MLIARWQIDARFGHKQEVIDRIKSWARDIAPQAGLTQGRVLTGSIGALEATVIHDWEVEDLASIDAAWKRIASIPAHAQWGRELEPFVVSGTSRWDIYRVV
jgi:hypothetical protein